MSYGSWGSSRAPIGLNVLLEEDEELETSPVNSPASVQIGMHTYPGAGEGNSETCNCAFFIYNMFK